MDIIIPLHSSFLFAVFTCLFGSYIFAVRSQVIKYDGDNFNLEIKKLGHYHQTAVTDFKYVENYFKSKKMCMLDIGDEDIPEKYKRIEYFFPSKQYAKIMTKAGDVAFMHWFKVNEI